MADEPKPAASSGFPMIGVIIVIFALAWLARAPKPLWGPAPSDATNSTTPSTTQPSGEPLPVTAIIKADLGERFILKSTEVVRINGTGLEVRIAGFNTGPQAVRLVARENGQIIEGEDRIERAFSFYTIEVLSSDYSTQAQIRVINQ